MLPLGVSIATGIRLAEAFGAGRIENIRSVCVSSRRFTVAQAATVATLFLFSSTGSPANPFRRPS